MNGIINVYKERGYTSHDVVAKLRGILKQKKIWTHRNSRSGSGGSSSCMSGKSNEAV